ncbi:MAG: DNA polymerase III subunit alpha [Spirochaetales bacterium]|nr:DNA polymerase III subunit alpha [Spirochaetales bacterium]
MQEFVHLHNHSDYSLLDGAASVPSLVNQAVKFEMKHLALTDHGNMFGSINFYHECKKQGINPIIGCELYVSTGSRFEKTGSEQKNRYHHLIALASDETGYRNLMRLSSIGYTEGFYYKPRVDNEVIEKYSEGIIATSACINGAIPAAVIEGRFDEALSLAGRYREIFGKDRFYLELQDHGIPEQRTANRGLVEISAKTGIGLVATNDVHYTLKEDARAQDVLICIGTAKKLDDTERMKFKSEEYYLKSQEMMIRLFSEAPSSVANTLEIAEKCNLAVPFPGPQLPDYTIPEGFSSPKEYLKHLTFKGLERRYGEVTDRLKERAEYELEIITSMGFTGYFLIVWDFIRFALERGIPVGPGRGSGAASLVAYALNITNVEPFKYDLHFERFLNPERVSMPDFDIDFCYERRQEVINYVTEKYGENRVGQIITFGRLKAKAVLRDVARVLDFPYAEADNIAKLVPAGPKVKLADAVESDPRLKSFESENGKYGDLIAISKKLEGLNRHASTHAAGIVIGKSDLTDYVPLYRDTKTGSISTQYTWEQLEDCGLVKIDFLGLKTLTLIKNAENLVKLSRPEFEIDKIPDDDEATFALLGEGKSTCIFQFESSGMQNILKRAKPSRIADLIALNALYRPGPMENIDQFIDSKNGKQAIRYPLPQLESVLKETYGVIVYQEQVMEIARIVGGYSLGQADILRRAMGKKKADVMEVEKKGFIERAQKQGFSEKQATDIFDLLIPFAGYGFAKSHAAAYAELAYKTAYLKANFPAEFMAANLTNEIYSTEKLAQYIGECKTMGLEVLPPDINLSDKNFTVVNGRIVYGLMGLKNVGSGAVDEIIAARTEKGAYTSFLDFLEKADLRVINRKVVETVIKAGLFDSMGVNRATLMANLDRMIEFVAGKKELAQVGQASLFDGSEGETVDIFNLEKTAEWDVMDLLSFENEIMGFYFSGHPLDSHKTKWQRAVTIDLSSPENLSGEKMQSIIGLVRSVREIQTRRGSRMAFVQIEDYNGSIELVVFSDCWEKHRELLKTDSVVGVQGRLDTSRGDPKLIVERVMDPEALPDVAPSEVHIKLVGTKCEETQLVNLRSFLIDRRGECTVFLHTPSGSNGHEVVIKASPHLCVSHANEVLEEIRCLPEVEAVWQQ